MGLTNVDVDVANAAAPHKTERVVFLVDSGAAYSVVPGDVLRRLGIEPYEEQQFSLANGERIVRKLGYAVFTYAGITRASTVIFGEEGDSNLLGVVTLEELGFVIDPIRRELRPLPMLM